jgi:hypothetical protein
VTRLGELFLFKIEHLFYVAEVAHILGYNFPDKGFAFNFDVCKTYVNVLGYILGDFFHKLIWSPWIRVAVDTRGPLCNIPPPLTLESML